MKFTNGAHLAGKLLIASNDEDSAQWQELPNENGLDLWMSRRPEGSPSLIWTDWQRTSVSGVATLPGKPGTAAALLERQLREKGEIDEVATLRIHHQKQRTGTTELVYTAVPVSRWHEVQSSISDQASVYMVHDWVGSLVKWCLARGDGLHSLCVAHHGGVDLVCLDKGRVVQIEQLRRLGDEASAWARLAKQASLINQQNRDDKEKNEDPHSTDELWILEPDPELAAAFASAYTPSAHLHIACLPQTAGQVQSACPNCLVSIWSTDWLAQCSPVSAAVNPFVDKLASLTWKWGPRIGLIACLLSVGLGVASWVGYREISAYEGQSIQIEQSRQRWERLQQTVAAADQLAAQDGALREWLQKKQLMHATPDYRRVLGDIRAALPVGIQIQEVGLVVEKERHLITILGHAREIDESLQLEGQLANALKESGYSFVKRDLLLREGTPGFKLSMTWSPS